MTLTEILSISLLVLQFITVMFGWRVREKVAKDWQPMLMFFGISFIIALSGSFLYSGPGIHGIKSELLQSLAAALLILRQARIWKVFEGRLYLNFILLCLIIALFIIEVIFPELLAVRSSVFMVFSSFTITLLAIEMMNRNLPQSRVPFWRNPVFLFCAGLIFQYTLLGLIELFAGTLRDSIPAVLTKTYYFYAGISILVQLLYIRSVLCIPAKDKYYSY